MASSGYTTAKGSLENATVVVSGEYAYDATAHEPTGEQVKVTLEDGQVVDSDQYDITYKDNVNAGEATIKVTPSKTSDFAGSATGTFTIKKAEIDVSKWEWDYKEPLIFDGERKVVEVKSTNDNFDKVDLEYRGHVATNAGWYKVLAAATLKSEYENNYEVVGEIPPLKWAIARDLIEAIKLDIKEPVINEEPISSIEGDGYTVEITWEGNLKEGKFDYNEKYVANIVITPDNNHKFSESTAVDLTDNEKFIEKNNKGYIVASKEYTVAKGSLENATVEVLGEYIYNGEKQMPTEKDVKVTLEDGQVVDPSQYKIHYQEEDGIDAGDATILVVGVGDFAGSVLGTFTIKKAEIDVSNWEWDYTNRPVFDNTKKTILLKSDNANFDKVDLVYEENSAIDAGMYKATATATLKDDKNYTLVGTIKDLRWAITKKPIETVKLGLKTPVAKDKPISSIKGDGYTVAISWVGNFNNDKFDYNEKYYANMIITPDNNHKFIKSTTVDLAGCDFSKHETDQIILHKEYTTAKGSIKNATVEVLGEYIYNGEKQMPTEKDVKVTLEDGQVVDPSQYKIYYQEENGIDAGDATILVVGVGDFTGSVLGTFTIKKAEIDVSNCEWDYANPLVFDNTQKTIALKADNVDVDKVDLAYEGNTAINAGEYNATAKATVKTGYAKNYDLVGTIKDLKWAIARKPIEKVVINVPTPSGKGKPVYSLKEDGYTVAITWVGNFNNGRFDYNEKYYANMVITPDNNHEFTDKTWVNLTGCNFSKHEADQIILHKAYITSKASLLRATVEVLGEYTYNGLEQKPAGEQVKVTFEGQVVDPSQYDISYENNVNMGEATVKVTAKADSDFTGSQIGKFTIKPSPKPIVVTPEVPGIPDKGADFGMNEQQQTETDKTIVDIFTDLIKPDVKPDPNQPEPQSQAEKETAETEKNIIDTEKNNMSIKIVVEAKDIPVDNISAEYQGDAQKLEENVSKVLGQTTSKVLHYADISVIAYAIDADGKSTPLGNMNSLDKKIPFTIQLPKNTTGTNFGVARVYDGKVEFLPLTDIAYNEETKAISISADKFGTFTVFEYNPNAPELKLKSIYKIGNQVFEDTAIKPEVVVISEKGNVVPKDAYTVTWKINGKLGTAKVIVKAKEGSYYTGTLEQTYLIRKKPVRLAAVPNVKVETDNGLLRVSFGEVAGAETYRVYVKQLGTDGGFRWFYGYNDGTMIRWLYKKPLVKNGKFEVKVKALSKCCVAGYPSEIKTAFSNRIGTKPAKMYVPKFVSIKGKKVVAQKVYVKNTPKRLQYNVSYRLKGTKTWKSTGYSAKNVKYIRGLKEGRVYDFALRYRYKNSLDGKTYVYSTVTHKRAKIR